MRTAQYPKLTLLCHIILDILLAAFLLVATACGNSSDPGKSSCLMMQEDKANGTTPDEARMQAELKGLETSENSDLQKVAVAVQSGDLMQAANAIPLIYSGCASIGVTIR